MLDTISNGRLRSFQSLFWTLKARPETGVGFFRLRSPRTRPFMNDFEPVAPTAAAGAKVLASLGHSELGRLIPIGGTRLFVSRLIPAVGNLFNHRPILLFA